MGSSYQDKTIVCKLADEQIPELDFKEISYLHRINSEHCTKAFENLDDFMFVGLGRFAIKAGRKQYFDYLENYAKENNIEWDKMSNFEKKQLHLKLNEERDNQRKKFFENKHIAKLRKQLTR